VESGATGREPTGDVADVSTIQVKSDTLGQGFDLVLSEAGVRARGTRLAAGVAFLNAADQHIIGLAAHIGMRADHFMDLHRDISGSKGPFLPMGPFAKSSLLAGKKVVEQCVRPKAGAA